MVKKSVKRKRAEVEVVKVDNTVTLPAQRNSDEPVGKRTRWTNKQRVLVFATRGISHRDRHLMEDLKKLMPHHKPESKMERSKTLDIVNEMCEMKHCNKAILLEGRRKKDLYMWLSNVPNGPSVKFLIENIYTMAELKLTGNCLRGSRPLLSFDPTFVEKPHYQLLKELLTQIFGVPNQHPKSQPFFDHVYTFTVLDNRIWFRNFQILNDEGALAEVGPRFVFNPVKIFSGSFIGNSLWENDHYMSPASYRRQVNLAAKNKYVNRQEQKVHAEATKPKDSYKMTPLEDIFQGDPYEQAKQIQTELEKTVNGDGHDDITNKSNKKGKKTKETSKESKVSKKSIIVEEDDDDDDDSGDENDGQDDDDDDNEDEIQVNIANVMQALKKVKAISPKGKNVGKVLGKATKLSKPITKKSKVVTKIKKKKAVKS